MTETGWPLIPREVLPAPVPAARRRLAPRPATPADLSRQLPFFGAETTEPSPADLAGLLAGPGELGRMGGTARIIVPVDAAWRVHVLVAELVARGLVVNWRPLEGVRDEREKQQKTQAAVRDEDVRSKEVSAASQSRAGAAEDATVAEKVAVSDEPDIYYDPDFEDLGSTAIGASRPAVPASPVDTPRKGEISGRGGRRAGGPAPAASAGEKRGPEQESDQALDQESDQALDQGQGQGQEPGREQVPAREREQEQAREPEPESPRVAANESDEVDETGRGGKADESDAGDSADGQDDADREEQSAGSSGPRFEVLTAYSRRLNGLAQNWPEAAAQLFLSGPRLRLWVAAAGEPVPGGYALGLGAPEDLGTIDAALVRAGLAGRVSDDGRRYLIMGKRRLRRLAELVGERPPAAPEEVWPGGAGA